MKREYYHQQPLWHKNEFDHTNNLIAASRTNYESEIAILERELKSLPVVPATALSERKAEQWTTKEVIEREASIKLLEKSTIVAMSLVEGDMDQYITRQRDDSVHGQCFGKEWEIANTVNWDKFNKVVPTQYNSNIIAYDIIIGQAQIYDKKLWLRYTDENHSQIKRWLDENSDEIIRTSQFFLTSYPELAECHH